MQRTRELVVGKHQGMNIHAGKLHCDSSPGNIWPVSSTNKNLLLHKHNTGVTFSNCFPMSSTTQPRFRFHLCLSHVFYGFLFSKSGFNVRSQIAFGFMSFLFIFLRKDPHPFESDTNNSEVSRPIALRMFYILDLHGLFFSGCNA